MKLNRVTLTKDEAGWFSRNVPKMLELLEKSEKRNKGVTGRATYKLLKKMEEQAKEVAGIVESLEEQTVDVFLSRKEKLLLREMVNRMANGLEVVNEEYRKRGGHEEYIQANEYKHAYLQSMARKLK